MMLRGAQQALDERSGEVGGRRRVVDERPIDREPDVGFASQDCRFVVRELTQRQAPAFDAGFSPHLDWSRVRGRETMDGREHRVPAGVEVDEVVASECPERHRCRVQVAPDDRCGELGIDRP